MAVGFMAAAASAYVSIVWLLSWIRRQSLGLFVVYRVLLGLVILASVDVAAELGAETMASGEEQWVKRGAGRS